MGVEELMAVDCEVILRMTATKKRFAMAGLERWLQRRAMLAQRRVEYLIVCGEVPWTGVLAVRSGFETL